ncbi:N-6 DNA methylase [Cellulomonas sp.]|uniref:N-6 DNA methylase n=1 Tax=Cellulomonas sp. TaxID=40001 RepID=UPI003BAD13AB
MTVTTRQTLKKAQIAEIARVSRVTAGKWVQLEGFPPPIDGLGTVKSPQWDADAVFAWLDEQRKSYTRPDVEASLWATLNAWRDAGFGTGALELAGPVLSVVAWRYVSDPTSPAFVGLPDALQWRALTQTAPEDVPRTLAEGMSQFSQYVEGWQQLAFEPFLRSGYLSQIRDDPRLVVPLVYALDRFRVEDLPAVYDAFAERLDAAAGRVGGEFSTPPGLVDLIAGSVADIPGTVYDPVAGTGRLLLAVASRGTARTPLTAQDISSISVARLTQSAILAGVATHDLDIRTGDTLVNDQLPPEHADVIVMQPPFSVRHDGDTVWDARWVYGATPRNNADLLWPQVGLWHLKDGGRCVCLMPMGAAFRGGQEANVRMELLRAGTVEAIVALPAQMLRGTSVSAALWILARPGQTADAHRVLFIDMTDQGRGGQRGSLVTVDDTAITDALRAWRLERQVPEALPAAAVTVDEILAKGGNLNPRLFVQSAESVPPAQSFRQSLDELKSSLDRTAKTRAPSSALLTELTRAVPRTTIGDLAKVQGLEILRPRASTREPEHTTDGVPLASPGWVREGGDIPYIEESSLEDLDDVLTTRAGDVLVTESSRLAARVDREGGKVVLTTFVTVVRIRDHNIDPGYLAAVIPTMTNQESHMVGTTIKRLRIRDLPVPVLPIAEQRALAALADELEEVQARAVDLSRKSAAALASLSEAVGAGSIQYSPPRADATRQHQPTRTNLEGMAE